MTGIIDLHVHIQPFHMLKPDVRATFWKTPEDAAADVVLSGLRVTMRGTLAPWPGGFLIKNLVKPNPVLTFSTSSSWPVSRVVPNLLVHATQPASSRTTASSYSATMRPTWYCVTVRITGVRALVVGIAGVGSLEAVGRIRGRLTALAEYVQELMNFGQPDTFSPATIQLSTAVATVALDFGVLESLGALARERGLAGAVQHGASTLPDELFGRFPEVGTAEIHLATGFQNALYDHPAFPAELRTEINAWLHANAADEAKPGDTEEQFLYRTRKKALGPFKRALWEIPRKGEILAAQRERLATLFDHLGVSGSRQLVDRYVPSTPEPLPPAPEGLLGASR